MLALGLALAPLPFAPVALGASILVTTTADEYNTNPGACALREAIQAANTNAGFGGCAAGSSGNDTISFNLGGSFVLTRTGVNDDTNATGDLDIKESLTLQGDGAGITLIDGNNTDAVFDTRAASASMTIMIVNLTIQHGNPTGASFEGGGAIFVKQNVSLNLDQVQVLDNSANTSGAGIWNEGALSITGSLLAGNRANQRGGALYNTGPTAALSVGNSTILSNEAEFGAGIYDSAGGGSLMIVGSTFSANRALDRPGGTADLGDGGGLYASTDGGVFVVNSTFSGNTAVRSGGGLFFGNSTGGVGDSASLNNVTIAGNTANNDNNSDGDGGGIAQTSGTVNLKNTIIALNTDRGGANMHPDISGTFADQGFNLIGKRDGSSSFPDIEGDLIGTIVAPVDPRLGLLQANGGPTFTRALLNGSPAINAGSGCAGTDQRGTARPQGTLCDIGAFELVDTTPPDTTIIGTPPSFSSSATAVFGFTGTDPGGSGVGTFECQMDGGDFVDCKTGVTYENLAPGDHTFQVRAVDRVGNVDPTPANYTWTIDPTGPRVVSIGPVSPSPRNTGVESIGIVFSEPISGLELGDLDLTRGGADLLTVAQTLTSADDQTWTLGNLAGITSAGGTYTLTLTAQGSGIIDQDSKPLQNDMSTSWVVDATAPAVTINQSGSQPDPASSAPIFFAVVFSEPVSGFGSGDVTLGGTAGASVATVSGAGATYSVAVSGMTKSGTVVASIAAGVAADAVGNTSLGSTSTDNTVTFTPAQVDPPHRRYMALILR